MWWLKLRPTVMRRSFARGAVLLALCAPLAGCFEPMYAQKTLAGGPALQQRFARVGIIPIAASTRTLCARVAVELQNALAYDFTGGGGQVGKAYDLKITMTSQVQQV